MEKPYWEGKHYSFFSNKECEYFPCHQGADPENFNCLFCYCPLYALGDKLWEVIFVIRIKELRIVQIVTFLIREKIMDI